MKIFFQIFSNKIKKKKNIFLYYNIIQLYSTISGDQWNIGDDEKGMMKYKIITSVSTATVWLFFEQMKCQVC